MVQQRLGGITAQSLPVPVSKNRLQFHDPQVFKQYYQNLTPGPRGQGVKKSWDSRLET